MAVKWVVRCSSALPSRCWRIAMSLTTCPRRPTLKPRKTCGAPRGQTPGPMARLMRRRHVFKLRWRTRSFRVLRLHYRQSLLEIQVPL